MRTLPHLLYSADQVRVLDRLAGERFELPGATLMARAGAAAFAYAGRRWPRARRYAVVCGAGNNAGDGYVFARLAHHAGRQARVLQLADIERLHGDARTAAEAARAAGVPMAPLSADALAQCDVVVDALLGTGLSGEVREAARAAIEAVNASGRPVLAMDIPSGLAADSGAVLGTAVEASATVTFIGLKTGLFTGAGPDRCGEIRFEDLGVPAALYDAVPATAERVDEWFARRRLRPRSRTAHKGHFGHVLVVGGALGMLGAARMAGEAAARSGAGLVSLATRAEHAPLIAAVRPELMCHGVETAAGLEPLLGRASVVALGPGLGTGAWGRALFARLLEARQGLVVDADGLNLLAAEPHRRDDWVLTPHPGEAARLLGSEVGAVQHDRLGAVRELQARYGGTAVLKGAGTLIADDEGAVALCTTGNPGMASGGMGDLLTGTIAGLLAQGLGAGSAARLGVALHGAAADRAAAALGERGLLATDLLPHLHRLVNPHD